MSSESRYHPGADMQGFVRELMEFVGLDDADVAMIRRSAPAILKHGRPLRQPSTNTFSNFPPPPVSCHSGWHSRCATPR